MVGAKLRIRKTEIPVFTPFSWLVRSATNREGQNVKFISIPLKVCGSTY